MGKWGSGCPTQAGTLPTETSAAAPRGRAGGRLRCRTSIAPGCSGCDWERKLNAYGLLPAPKSCWHGSAHIRARRRDEAAAPGGTASASCGAPKPAIPCPNPRQGAAGGCGGADAAATACAAAVSSCSRCLSGCQVVIKHKSEAKGWDKMCAAELPLAI